MTTEDIVEISPGPAPDRRRRRFAAAGLVLVVLAGGGGIAAWAATRDGATAGAGGSGLSCPATTPGPFADDPVPAKPTVPDLGGRLVPDATPDSVLICEYADVFSGGVPWTAPPQPEPPGTASTAAPGTAATGAPGTAATGAVATASAVPAEPEVAPTVAAQLARQATHPGSDAAVTALVTTLRNAPPASGFSSCGGTGASVPSYLVGLTYPDGVVWLDATACAGTTNGTGTSPIDVLAALATVLGDDPDAPVSASAVPPDPGSPVPVPGGSTSPGAGGGSPGSSGDPGPSTGPAPGDDPGVDPLAACVVDTPATTGAAKAFVPFTPTGVRVCRATLDPSVAPPPAVDEQADVAADLVTALAALPLMEPDTMCTDIAGPRWALLFRGADGAAELVTVDAGGCGTASNGQRVARIGPDFVARLSALW